MRARVVSIFVAALMVASALVVTATGSAEGASNPWPHSIVGGFSNASGDGYWLTYADGTVEAFGEAKLYGDASNLALNGPIVGGAVAPDNKGYWLVAFDGGIFSYGSAVFYGSTGNIPLNQPVFSMTPTRSGKGYWLVAFDGGIFTFGDGKFYGSTGNLVLNQPITGITTSPSGKGYRMVARDGGIFSFGDVKFHGSLPGIGVAATDVVGMAPTPTAGGYWIVRSTGETYAFGNAKDFGDYNADPADPVAGIFAHPNAQGYRLVTQSGKTVPFGTAPGTPSAEPAEPPKSDDADDVPKSSGKGVKNAGSSSTDGGKPTKTPEFSGVLLNASRAAAGRSSMYGGEPIFLPATSNWMSPNAAVGKLDFVYWANGQVQSVAGSCTGTVVSRAMVLTAAHCAFAPSGFNYIRFRPALYGSSAPYGVWYTKVENAWIDQWCQPFCRTGTPINTWENAFDYALIKFPPASSGKYLGDVVGTWSVLTEGQNLTSSARWSYGYPVEGWFGEWGGLYPWYCNGENEGSEGLISWGNGYYSLGLGCQAHGGQSGGPILGYYQGAWYIISVNSTMTYSVSCPSNTVYCSHRGWYLRNLWGPVFNQHRFNDFWNDVASKPIA